MKKAGPKLIAEADDAATEATTWTV